VSRPKKSSKTSSKKNRSVTPSTTEINPNKSDLDSRLRGNDNGCLFICATPIGNLSDTSARLLETLNVVDRIVAEDTRTTLKLLNHFSIKKPLSHLEKYNEYTPMLLPPSIMFLPSKLMASMNSVISWLM
jgi:hypothetical protein